MIKEVFDIYTIKARIFPAFILLMPIAFLFLGLFPKWSSLPSNTIATIFFIAVLLLIADYVRGKGKKLETEYVSQWGGYPSSIALRHDSGVFNEITFKSIRQKIQTFCPDIQLPTEDDEKSNPQQANDTYDEVVRRLREKTRDTSKFALLFKENISYGFHRNLAALKIEGIMLSVFCLIMTIAIVILRDLITHPISYLFIYISLIVSGIMLLLWIFVFTEKWVRKSADIYVKQLFNSLENLDSKQ